VFAYTIARCDRDASDAELRSSEIAWTRSANVAPMINASAPLTTIIRPVKPLTALRDDSPAPLPYPHTRFFGLLWVSDGGRWLTVGVRITPNPIVPVLVAAALAAASCGGGSGSSSSSGAAGAGSSSSTGNGGSGSSTGNGGSGQRPARPQLTAAQLSCLKQQGVTMPGQGSGTSPGGGPPGGGNGAPGGGGNGAPGGSQQFQQRRQKMAAAFQKCGVPAPQFGGGAAKPGGTTQ
jgi:hypothetical protein